MSPSSSPSPGLSEYERACAHDRAGEEQEAIPHYEQALQLGLDTVERRGALVGLGSFLRNVGRHEDSVRILTEALAEYPGDAALGAFRALALHSQGNHTHAVTTLLDVVLQHAPVGQYQRALSWYRDELLRQDAHPENR